MKYQINIEQKIEKNKIEREEYCNVISTKDSIITRIIPSKGTEIKDINDSIKKGDILISGDIKFNEEIKKQICANGIVYGKTWYTINISVPKEYEKIEEKTKKRYNILIKENNKSYKIFKSRLTNYIERNKKIINIFGFEIYLQKEIEVTKNKLSYTEPEIEDLITQKVTETMSKTLIGDSQILERKVLKKQENNSTIELEIFIVAEEQISTVKVEELKKE